MLKDILRFEITGGRYSALLQDIGRGTPAGVFALTQQEKLHFAAYNPYFTLYITPDRLSARTATARLLELLGEDRAVCLPEREDVLLHRRIAGREIVYERSSALASLCRGTAKVCVMPADALVQYYPSAEQFKKLVFTLRKGGRVDISGLIIKLAASNYKREERVLEKGSFSVRGDIVEIYPTGYELPFRISIFDDEIEYIKVFEPESMLSTGEAEEIIIAPATDILLPKESAKEILIRIKRNLQTEEARLRTDEILGDIKSIMELHQSSPSLIWLTPYIGDWLSTVFEYLPSDTLIIFDEPRNTDERLKLVMSEHETRLKRLVYEGEALDAHIRSIMDKNIVYGYASHFKTLVFQTIKSSNPVTSPEALYSFKGRPVSAYYLDFASLIKDINTYLSRNTRIVIAAGDKEKAENLIEHFRREETGAAYIENINDDFMGLAVIPEKLSNGLIFPEAQLIILGGNDVFRKGAGKTIRKKRAVFTMPEINDYVVHEVHGIGRCEGIIKLTAGNSSRDYVLIRYKDGDKLYVPIDQLDLIERYSGGESNPELSKIGGKEFEKIKESVKKSVKKLAIDLIEVYSKREKQEGIKYSADTPWQKEFEDSFPYEETPDQLDSIREIKSDMESGRIMDRLICGDVGYGKTEVALRAVFKTVMGGRQAAILAPTTILAEQHFATAEDRFRKFGVKTAALTRFLQPKEVQDALKALERGDLDVVIATHRLLSKDVVFKDLGLLVLDEEQRFGVEHKEKIKALKTNINVLTLTATPIPRTLNMALTGIRDISVLETPPVGRLPVATYITEYTDALVEDACGRELAREGQVIILYNDVATIEQYSAKLRRLLPDARITVAHGQMSDTLLEQAITNIYERRADILVCSTIIENGIDLPLANTLIVCDADRLGLTELYQLRGRVGRRDRLASAYFTVREGKVLTSDAERRLQALAEYTEFGSGFKIAMKDLEIRGAGNILGREQHGHMQKVGYEMYCKLLDDAVRELKGEKAVQARDAEVLVAADAYIGEELAGGEDNKLKLYKRISMIRDLEDRDNVIKELKDILKSVDEPLINLIDISLMRALASNLGIKKVIINDRQTALIFNSGEAVRKDSVMYALSSGKDLLLTNTAPPSVVFNLNKLPVRRKMDRVINFLLNAS